MGCTWWGALWYLQNPRSPDSFSPGTETLLRLRSWTSELQDYSEALRGVVPGASGVGPALHEPVVAATRVTHLAPGAVGKAAGP